MSLKLVFGLVLLTALSQAVDLTPLEDLVDDVVTPVQGWWHDIFRRSARHTHVTVADVGDVTITGTAEIYQEIAHVIAQAHSGILGADLIRAAKRVSQAVDIILTQSGVNIDWEGIRRVILRVLTQLNTRGGINASLALWDGLALLLNNTTDPTKVPTILAAIKLVSDSIINEPISPGDKIVYINVPYPVPKP